MRLLLVRHGESQENVAMMRVVARLLRRELRPGAEFDAAMDRAMVDATPPSGDSPLSEKGRGEAAQLGAYWAPLLASKMEKGRLRAFVSPQSRCMETADPLFTALGVKAQVLPDMVEVPGLRRREDSDAFFPKYDALTAAGKASEALAWRRQFNWRPCGATIAEYTQRYPWARFDAQAAAAAPALQMAESGPFWTYGWRTPEEEEARGARCVARIRELSRELGDGDVVLWVSHGASSGLVVRDLLGAAPTTGFFDVANTSVTCIHLPPPPRPGKPPTVFSPYLRGAASVPPGEPEAPQFTVRLEFFNQYPHLGADERMRQWAEERNLMPRAKL